MIEPIWKRGDIMNWILIWVVLLVVFVVIEVLTMGLTTLWFAGGALVAAVLAALNLPSYVQIAAFIVVSLVLIFSQDQSQYVTLMWTELRRMRKASSGKKPLSQVPLITLRQWGR